MKYTAQVVYTNFTEVFTVDLEDSNLDIKLKEIREKPIKKKDILTLDLSQDIKTGYSVFPYEPGDLTIIQVHNIFVVASFVGESINWYKFSAQQLVEYLLGKDVTSSIIPYMGEDKQIVLNALLSDFVRSDFSFSELNKKVKYLKVATLLSFIKDKLNCAYSRVLLDETVLGDIDVDHVAIAFRFSNERFLKLLKINNLSKILVLLEREKIIAEGYKFVENTFFINNPTGGDKAKLIFAESGIKFDYQVLPAKNYIFDLSDKEYMMNVGNIFKAPVRGKVYVFNGDERDLMIN